MQCFMPSNIYNAIFSKVNLITQRNKCEVQLTSPSPLEILANNRCCYINFTCNKEDIKPQTFLLKLQHKALSTDSPVPPRPDPTWSGERIRVGRIGITLGRSQVRIKMI